MKESKPAKKEDDPSSASCDGRLGGGGDGGCGKPCRCGYRDSERNKKLIWKRLLNQKLSLSPFPLYHMPSTIYTKNAFIEKVSKARKSETQS